MKILLVAGARPNFMKIAPLYREAQKYPDVACGIVHTGQHYDYEMSQAFFKDLDLPMPDFFLNTGSGSHAGQTAKIMTAFENVCQDQTPDWVVVVGDVNSTLACAITAKKLLLKVAHVEAGLRSFDMTMPEEVNRMVTDSISDLFFVTEQSGVDNLLREGKAKEQIHFVGHVMIDNLLFQKKRLEHENTSGFSVAPLKPQKGSYAFLTLHRPSNVDDKETFEGIVRALSRVSERFPILFPVHPRTKKKIEEFNIRLSENVVPLPPLGFKEALFLWKDARFVITDSGGLQEETTALGIPCLTLRENTERPITLKMGTNILAGNQENSILGAYGKVLEKDVGNCGVPPKWDGKAAERIWKVLLDRQ